MKSLLISAILLLSSTFANAQHEYAPLREHELKYKDWTYKSVRDDREINLRDFARNKKLVMVVYFAQWCPNWKYEAPVAQKLYDKYKAQGFDVIGVSEYDTVEKTKANLETLKVTFPVVAESFSYEAREKTPHNEYRRKTEDTRKWGSPWNLFIETSALEAKGDTLLKKAFVVNGELIETDVEKFIRQKLGLPVEEKQIAIAAKDKTIEVCEPDSKKEASFKKP
jgi:thiol-disulfide isomerase/thioredoxin